MCNEKETCIMITFKLIPNFFFFFLEPVSNHLTSQNQPHLCSSRSIFMVSRIIRSRFDFSVVTFAAHVPKWWYLCSFLVEHLNAFDFCRFFPQHVDSDTAFFPLSLSFTQCKAHFPSDSTLFEKIFINQRGLRSNHSWPACFTILSVCVCWWEDRDHTHSSSSLKTAYLWRAVSFSSLVTYLPARHFEREILPSMLKLDPDCAHGGPGFFKLRSASVSWKMRASRRITETVAEGRMFANEDMLL